MFYSQWKQSPHPFTPLPPQAFSIGPHTSLATFPSLARALLSHPHALLTLSLPRSPLSPDWFPWDPLEDAARGKGKGVKGGRRRRKGKDKGEDEGEDENEGEGKKKKKVQQVGKIFYIRPDFAKSMQSKLLSVSLENWSWHFFEISVGVVEIFGFHLFERMLVC